MLLLIWRAEQAPRLASRCPARANDSADIRARGTVRTAVEHLLAAPCGSTAGAAEATDKLGRGSEGLARGMQTACGVVVDREPEEHRQDRERGHERRTELAKTHVRQSDGGFFSDDASWRSLSRQNKKLRKEKRPRDRDTLQVFFSTTKDLEVYRTPPPCFCPARTRTDDYYPFE